MPSHKGIDLDRAGPVNQNAPAVEKAARQSGEGGKESGRVMGSAQGLRSGQSRQPQATSLPGELHIIEHPSRGSARTAGIPGIIHTTSLGPDQRHRLVDGIIDLSASNGRAADGPVHKVAGHDATAMNAGMRPLPGAPIHRSR